MKEIKFYNLKFIEKKCEFNSIYTFCFQALEPISFIAGQWVHLGFPTENRDKSMVRHMSFASAPGDKFLEFTMDLSSGTAYKNKMAELNPGDVIRAFKIVGGFTVDSTQQTEVVFISGGIGITPARAIIRDLEQKKAGVNWSLLHLSRDQFLYEKEFSQYKNQQVRVNRAGLDAVWETILDKPANTKYYVSGSKQFVEGITERLESSQISKENIFIEDFH